MKIAAQAILSCVSGDPPCLCEPSLFKTGFSMPTIHDTPPVPVQANLSKLGQELTTVIPTKNDTNLLIAIWNFRRFGSLTREWTADAADTPKRDLRGLKAICGLFIGMGVVKL